TPKIADFGLAKRLDAVGTKTLSGAIIGTPSYMSPEQAQGRVGDVGPATDVHALGAVLYEALTGKPPYRGPTVFDTLNQVVNEPPVPASRLRPDVPAGLEAICLRCLEKEPARRYQSAAELADGLLRYLGNQPNQDQTVVLPQTNQGGPARWGWAGAA